MRYLRGPLNGGGHRDHIIALANGGSNWPDNFQLLCRFHNVQKHTQCLIEFALRHGRDDLALSYIVGERLLQDAAYWDKVLPTLIQFQEYAP